MLMFDFGGVLYGINYLALRQAITPDLRARAHDRDDAIPHGGRWRRSDRWSGVSWRRASAPAATLLTVGVLGFAARRGRRAVVAGATPSGAPRDRRGIIP